VTSALPLPPTELVGRIGPMGEDPLARFERMGEVDRRLLDEIVPDDWSWQGKRVLDFGCGAGRVIRRFAEEAEAKGSEFWGCDLDTPSIEWLRENLEPPFRFFESAEEPGLPQENGYFDLIYAFSVYTHFTDNWAGWLHEHHRVLADGGLLFATFLGEGMLEAWTGEPWDEDRIGMNHLLQGYPWDLGGPVAFNSPWWLRAHWGRAFEIVELRPVREEGAPSHGLIVARKKPVAIDVEGLIAPEPNEPREIAALQHHVEQLAAEARDLRHAHDDLAERLQGLEAARRAEVERLQGAVNSMQSSLSWRLTTPLRRARTLLTGLRSSSRGA
jgi:SAM-dependent methyltransferase